MFHLPPRSPDYVPLLVDGPLGAVHRSWRLRPAQDTLVLIVRAVGCIGLDGAVDLAPEPAPPSGELHRGDDPVASLARASDLAPFKPRVDVTLVGHAYPRRAPATTAHVQLAIGKLRARVAVLGDRAWSGGRPGEPAPFERMPLVWERAFGGRGHAVNPVGVGLEGDRLPNLEQPEALLRSRREQPEPACLAPLTRTWPGRARLLGSYDRKWLAERWPYFPADLDWGYFNAAPAALQLDALRGDERFDLAGVHPEVSVLSGRLPAVAPRAYALRAGPGARAPEQLALTLDTVAFDADRLEVSLVWRGLLDVSSAEAPELAALLVCAAALDERLAEADVRQRLERALVARYGPEVISSPVAAPAAEPRSSPARGAHGHRSAPPPEPPLLGREEALSLIASGTALAGLSLSGCDLHEVDLAGRDLRGAHLIGADLRGARLGQADLSGAVMARVALAGADLAGAKLARANLAEARLEGASLVGADLSGASLAESRAAGANFAEAVLAGAQLVDADLEGACFDRARAPAADLSGARLGGASFIGAEVNDAQLYDCAARGARFDQASAERLRADGADLSAASFTGAKASGASFATATLSGACLGGAVLDDADLSHARLDGALLAGASAKCASFRGAELPRLRAAGANLMEACLQGADLTDADLRGANLYATDSWKAELAGVRLDGALLAGSKLAR